MCMAEASLRLSQPLLAAAGRGHLLLWREEANCHPAGLSLGAAGEGAFICSECKHSAGPPVTRCWVGLHASSQMFLDAAGPHTHLTHLRRKASLFLCKRERGLFSSPPIRASPRRGPVALMAGHTVLVLQDPHSGWSHAPPWDLGPSSSSFDKC